MMLWSKKLHQSVLGITETNSFNKLVQWNKTAFTAMFLTPHLEKNVSAESLNTTESMKYDA